MCLFHLLYHIIINTNQSTYLSIFNEQLHVVLYWTVNRTLCPVVKDKVEHNIAVTGNCSIVFSDPDNIAGINSATCDSHLTMNTGY